MDPKYANLPWIATDNKDVYETDELPESDQNLPVQGDNGSAAVEVLTVNPDEAFKHFADKSLNSEGADFSDRIAPLRRMGYTSGKEHFETLSEDERNRETPAQTFRRLQAEIHLLTRQVKEAKSEVLQNGAPGSEGISISPEQMSSLSAALQESMHELELLTTIESEKGVHVMNSGGLVHKHLLTHIDGFKDAKQKNKLKKPASGDSKDGDKCVYQMHYHGDQQKTALSARYAQLEQRIDRVEALLGNNPTKVSILTADSMSHGLLEGVHKICARSSLLTAGHLDQVEGRFNTLHQKLQSITEKKDALTQADTQNKIAELYALVKKWESLCGSLPNVLDRLASLKRLHDQASHFSQTLALLDKSQQQLETTIKSNEHLLNGLKSSLDNTIVQVQQCTEKLQSSK